MPKTGKWPNDARQFCPNFDYLLSRLLFFFFPPFIVICETWESSNIVNPQCVSYYPDYLLMFLSCHVHVASDLSTILDMIQPPAANEKCIVLLLVDK